MTSRYFTLPALVAALGVSATAAAAEPTTAELRDQVEQLKAEVAQLRSGQQSQQAQLDQYSQRDVDATVDRVLQDAERRSQLMQLTGFTAGYDKGRFVLQSSDGKFSLSPGVQFQFRHVTNWLDEAQADGDSSTESGFEVRRAKFNFAGNAFSKDLTYNFQWETSEAGGGVTLEEAWVRYKFADQLAFRMGQFKDNVFHEETTSSKRQLAVDRSLLNEVIGGGDTDYVQGAALQYDADQFRAEVAIHDGLNSDNTNFLDNGQNFGVSGRVELAVMGRWRDYEDFTARGTNDNLLVIGAGADWTQFGDSDVVYHTVDVQFENEGGLGIYAAGLAVWSDDVAADDEDTYDYGGLVQVGYAIPDTNWELFGRYNILLLDDEVLPADAEDTYHEITVGVNHYFHGHAAKFTLDVSYLPNGSPQDATGIGVLASDEDEIVLRGQFQLLL